MKWSPVGTALERQRTALDWSQITFATNTDGNVGVTAQWIELTATEAKNRQ